MIDGLYDIANLLFTSCGSCTLEPISRIVKFELQVNPMSLRDIRLSSFRASRHSNNGGSIHSEDVSVLLNDTAENADSFHSNSGLEARGDSVVAEQGELTMSTKYRVSKLPAVPTPLKRSRHQQPRNSVDIDRAIQGHFDEATGYALVQTGSSIHIWAYKNPSRVPETFTFNLDNNVDINDISTTTVSMDIDSAVEYEALSFLVAPGPGSRYPGLVTIDQNSGNFTYWQDVGTAGASDLLNQRKGQSTVVKMHPSDKITVGAVVEPAGIVFGFASGREVLITLRDMQGRVNLQVHSLNGPLGDGIFASLKGILSGHGGTEDLVSVVPGPEIGRTERIAMFLGSKGHLSAYACSRSGQSRRLLQVNLSAIMANEIAGVYSNADESLFLHDGVVHGDKVYILASVETQTSKVAYIVFTFNVGKNFAHEPELESTYRLLSYGESFSEYQCQLYLSERGSSATLFAVFQDAVVMLDASCSVKGPVDNQGIVPRRWEAPITMTRGFDIIGAVAQCKSYGLIAMVRNLGVLDIERIVDISEQEGRAQTSEEAETDLLMSLLEQAIFYGSRTESTSIAFDRRSELQFSDKSVNECFLAVSRQVLEAKSRWMAAGLPSTADYLKCKTDTLQKLAEYAQDNFEAQLSTETKLQLIMDMERAAAAGGLWSVVSKQRGEQLDDAFVNGIEETLRSLPLKIASTITEAFSATKDPEYLLISLKQGAFTLGDLGSKYYKLANDAVSPKVDPWCSKPELIKICEDSYRQLLGSAASDRAEMSKLIRLVDLLCRLYTERINWLEQCGYTSDAENVNRKFSQHRTEWIRTIVQAGHIEDALLIAEEYKLFRALAETILDRWQASNSANSKVDLVRCELRINENMDRFGYAFAEAMYGYLVDSKRFNTLMNEFTQYQDYLDRFLQDNRLHKLAWIRQVENQQYHKACETLLDDVESGNHGVSSAQRQFELSVAKLAALASQSPEPSMQKDAARISQSIDAKLFAIQVQLQLEKQVNMEDEKHQLVHHINNKYPGLCELARDLIDRVTKGEILSVDELIDLLTLVEPSTSKESSLNFYRALELASIYDRRRLRMVWRRLYLRDDWTYMSEFSQNKSDEEKKAMCQKTILYKTLEAFHDQHKQLDQESLAICRNPLILGQVLVVEEETESSMLRDRYPLADDELLQMISEDLNAEAQHVSFSTVVQWVKQVFAQAEHDLFAQQPNHKSGGNNMNK